MSRVHFSNGQGFLEPDDTTLHALDIDMPASATGRATRWLYDGTQAGFVRVESNVTNITLSGRDLGNNVPGPSFTANRNTSAGAVGPAAGAIILVCADGTSRALWVDNTRDLRIHTGQPTGSTGSPTTADTAGEVVGDQTSWHEAKNVGEQIRDAQAALQRILDAEVYEFTYKESGYQTAEGEPQTFTGLVGYDRNDWFLKNCGPQQTPALDEVSVIGHLVLAVQALAERVRVLENRV